MKKHCPDCKHCFTFPSGPNEYELGCNLTYHTCRSSRKDKDLCGPEAKHFEPVNRGEEKFNRLCGLVVWTALTLLYTASILIFARGCWCEIAHL